MEVEDGVVRRIRAGRDPRGEDLKGAIVAPGLVDVHIHGYRGHDTNSGDPGELLSLAEDLLRHGVTSLVPTAVAAPHDELLRIAQAVAKAVREQEERPRGARILGLHLEGPYINPGRAGAQNRDFIRDPDWDEFREYWWASRGRIKAITIAPELPGALDFIRRATELGIAVSIGHTEATYEETLAAIRAGARRVTHLFNAMPRIHHRAPGAVVACLESPEVVVELIWDLIHVSPPMLRLAMGIAGSGRVALVSDSIPAAGMPDGRHTLGGLTVWVRDGIPRLENGSLAGSNLTLEQAVRNAVVSGVPPPEAISMATAVPARAVGERAIGHLKPGAFADFIVLDGDLSLRRVYLAGKRVL